MLKVKGRVLPPPVVTYGANKSLQPNDGAWNLINTRFFEPKSLTAWAIVSLCYFDVVNEPRDGPEASLNAFLSDFRKGKLHSNLGFRTF